MQTFLVYVVLGLSTVYYKVFCVFSRGKNRIFLSGRSDMTLMSVVSRALDPDPGGKKDCGSGSKRVNMSTKN